MTFDTKQIRNVVLLGHSGAGKTTLSEAMLFEAQGIKRRGTIEAGNTASDYTSIEQERGNSIYSTLLHANWKDSKINILDTPGYDDFIGEVASSLKVADTAVMVLHARNGVEVGTEILWEYIEQFNTPTLFVINHMDEERADYENTLAQAQARFGKKVLPIQYTTRSGIGFNSIIDALRMVMYVFPDGGGRPIKKPIPEEEMPRALVMHDALVEAAAENDDTLMEHYFDQGTLNEKELAKGLTIALANREIFPVFIASAERNMGSGRIMGFLNDIAPSPADSPPAQLAQGSTLQCSTDDDTSIFIYKTITEPSVGQVSYFKVFSGALSNGTDLYNDQTRGTERFNQLYIANGKSREPVDELRAGDIGVTVKLKNSHTNNTLNQKGTSRSISPIVFPPSRIRTAVQAHGKNDMEKLMKALHQIQEEDPTLIIEQSASLAQTILHGQGQLHLDLIKHRIESVNKVEMEYVRPKVSYRETITKSADEVYRHKKQTGGSGQFAEVHMRIEPYTEGMPPPEGLNVRHTEEETLESGGKLVFLWCIVGGSIDSKFSNAIKKGILSKMESGPLTGSPCQDIRVSIYDGKMHSVDSNDQAFMTAASLAFKNAFPKASPQLLEPIYDLEVLCSDDVMGDVMGDLQTRRAIITGMETEGHYQKIKAFVPVAEMYQYASTLRSITQGRAKFNRKFAHYQAVTPDIQARLIDRHQQGQFVS